MPGDRGPISSRQELDAYLTEDLIECLECGRRFAFLGRHLPWVHGMSSAEYRTKWALPAGTPLAGRSFRDKRSAIASRLVAEGKIGQFAEQAQTRAWGSDRTPRVNWERAEQAARATANPPYVPLPSGEPRRDGRDPERAREYNAAWRAERRGDPEPMRLYRLRYP